MNYTYQQISIFIVIIFIILLVIILLPTIVKSRLKPIALKIVTSIQFELHTAEGKEKKEQALKDLKKAITLMIPWFWLRLFVTSFITNKNLDNLIEWAYNMLKPDFHTEIENTNKIINNTLYLVDKTLLYDNMQNDVNFSSLIEKIQENSLVKDFTYKHELSE